MNIHDDYAAREYALFLSSHSETDENGASGGNVCGAFVLMEDNQSVSCS